MKTTITFSRTQSPGHPFTQDAGLRLLVAAVPRLLCYPPSNYFSITPRVSPSQLASIDYTRVVDVSPACIQFRLAFSSTCTDGEDLVSGQPVAQLAVRSRVAPNPQPFSEWCLLHYYSHDSNGERLTWYIYAHACMGLSASFTFSLH